MGTDTTPDLPSQDQVRGAVDWALYFYSLPGYVQAGEEDQTDALYRVLGDDLAKRLIDRVVRARASELEAGETRTEWRVRDGWAVQMGPVEPYANWAWKRAREYGSAAEVQQRVIRTSPWVPVEDETEESTR